MAWLFSIIWGKANIVIYALSKKIEIMGNLALLVDKERLLAMGVQRMANSFMWLGIIDQGKVLGYVEVQSLMLEHIKGR